jgi:hypothetical protein
MHRLYGAASMTTMHPLCMALRTPFTTHALSMALRTPFTTHALYYYYAFCMTTTHGVGAAGVQNRRVRKKLQKA